VTYWKSLDERGRSFTACGQPWWVPTPRPDGSWRPTPWRPEVRVGFPCSDELLRAPALHRYRAHRDAQILRALGASIYLAQVRDPMDADDGFGAYVCCTSVRLLCPVEWWSDELALHWARDCYEHALGVIGGIDKPYVQAPTASSNQVCAITDVIVRMLGRHSDPPSHRVASPMAYHCQALVYHATLLAHSDDADSHDIVRAARQAAEAERAWQYRHWLQVTEAKCQVATESLPVPRKEAV